MNPKYVWSSGEFDNYIKNEIQMLKNKKKVNIGTVCATDLLLNNFIKPNEVHLHDLIIPSRKKGWKKKVSLFMY